MIINIAESEWEWLLFNANSAIYQLYQQEQVNFQWDDEEFRFVLFVLDQQLSWIFIVLPHWSNNPQIDMSPHSDTLSWFWANGLVLYP